MKLTVNGIVFDNPFTVTIECDVAAEGETIGPILVLIRGGRLYVPVPTTGAALTIQSVDGGALLLGDPIVAYDPGVDPFRQVGLTALPPLH